MTFWKFFRRRLKHSSHENYYYLLAIAFSTGLLCGISYSEYSFQNYSDRPAKEVGVINQPRGGFARLVHRAFELNGSLIEQLFYESQNQRYQTLFNEVRILCWVCTSAKTVNRSYNIKVTWGRRCNKIIYISEEEDDLLPTVKVNAPAGRDGLWAKTFLAFHHIYNTYIQDFDYFLKTDDDTYVLVENLRKLLLPYDPDGPQYFGFHFKTIVPQGYMSGGAGFYFLKDGKLLNFTSEGYVLSREAVKRLVTISFVSENVTLCPKAAATNDSEDVIMGRCLYYAQVPVGDSRDDKGHNRFSLFTAEEYVHPDLSKIAWWYWYFIKWPHKEKEDCCSKFPITFHYMTPHHFYMMEHLAYNLNIFGVTDVMVAESPGSD